MSKTSKTAFGGIMIALSVVVLMPTVFELFVYALPAIAGIITMVCVIEINKKWAFGVYAATAVLSLLIVSNKEAPVVYAAFFGFYPILKSLLETKAGKVLEFVAKFAFFNVAIAVYLLIMTKVFGVPFNVLMDLDSLSGFMAKYAVPIMLVIGNVIFVLYDFMLTKIATLYLMVWHKRVKRIFNFK